MNLAVITGTSVVAVAAEAPVFLQTTSLDVGAQASLGLPDGIAAKASMAAFPGNTPDIPLTGPLLLNTFRWAGFASRRTASSDAPGTTGIEA